MAETPNTENALRTAFDLGRAGTPVVTRPDGGIVAFVPRDTQRVEFDPIDDPLTHIKQGVTLHDEASFVAYVNRFKTKATQVFAEPGFLATGIASARVIAHIDFHEPGAPDHCDHVATYTPRYSEQWTRWTKACAQPMKQAEFAEFIEECRADIREPEAARLLDIVRTFKASKKVEFDSVVYQPNGDVKLAYDERTQQQGSSGALPEMMTLGIPVYFRGTAYAVPVLVRYKVGNGAVMFQLKLDRADVIEDAAFGELTARVSEATGIKAYLGRAI